MTTQDTKDELIIHFDIDRHRQPVVNRLKARVQGEVIFIGDYWLMADEARQLRDWLNKVLP